MRLITIAPKIYNRTRPPHQSNDKHNTFTPNIFNHYRIMIDQSNQIIPDSQSVVRCLDETFLISDLLEKFKIPVDDQKTFLIQLRTLHLELKHSGYSRECYLDKIETFLDRNTIIENKGETFREVFEDGVNCNLLQPEGKGWQKGKLKICFEFIPEEPESLATQEKPVKTQSSPLDEIRQLATELASVGLIK
jgi:KGK domain